MIPALERAKSGRSGDLLQGKQADALVPEGVASPSPTVPASLADTRWYGRFCSGDLRSSALDEVRELFHCVGGHHATELDIAELRAALTRERLPPNIDQQVDALLQVVEAQEGGCLEEEAFLQAMRLGSDTHAAALAARLRGEASLSDGTPGRIERRRLIGYLRHRKELHENWLSLPFTLALYVVFFILVISHLHQQTVFKITEAVEHEVPLVMLQEAYPTALWAWLEAGASGPRLAHFNRLVGGIHLRRQSRVGQAGWNLETLCPYGIFDFLGAPAHTEPHVCRSAGQAPGNDTQQWIMWSLTDAEKADAISQVRDWWRAPDSGGHVPLESPERVQVSMLAQNINVGYHVFYRLVFDVSESGAVIMTKIATAVETEPIWLNAREDWKRSPFRRFVMFMDIVFIALLGSLSLGRLYSFVAGLQRLGHTGTASGDFWTFMDWAHIALGFFLVLQYLYSNDLSRGLQELIGKLPALDEQERLSNAHLRDRVLNESRLSWDEYNLSLEAALEQVVLVAKSQGDQRWFAAFLVCSICVRFFKAFRANPQLNVLTRTVERAFGDFAHFFVVFACVFMAFVVVGHAVFGSDLKGFSSIGEAVHTTFLFMMGLNFDTYKDKIFNSGGALAVVWTALFHIVLVVLLLDMIMAIILEVYTEVRAAAGEVPASLLQQAWDAFADRKAYKRKLGATSMEAPSKLSSWSSQEESTDYSGTGGRPDYSMRVNQSQNRSDSMRVNESLPLVAPAKVAEPEVRRRPVRKWTEARLLRALEKQGDDSGTVSSRVLNEQLQVAHAAESLQLEALLQHAVEGDTGEPQAVSLGESLRLCGRTDANLRELTPLVRELAERSRRWEAERELLLGQLERAKAAAEGEEEGGPRRPGFATETAATIMRANAAAVRADPEGERTDIGSTGLHLERLVESRVSCAAAAQAERHARLEEAVNRLGTSLEPVLEGSLNAQAEEMTRLQKLEEKLESLATMLGPILDMEAAFRRTSSFSATSPRAAGFNKQAVSPDHRPPPPRVLVEPAPGNLPRSNTKGLGTGALPGGR